MDDLRLVLMYEEIVGVGRQRVIHFALLPTSYFRSAFTYNMEEHPSVTACCGTTFPYASWDNPNRQDQISDGWWCPKCIGWL